MTSLAVQPACYPVGLMLKAGGEQQSCDSSSQFPHCGAPSVASAFFFPSLAHIHTQMTIQLWSLTGRRREQRNCAVLHPGDGVESAAEAALFGFL